MNFAGGKGNRLSTVGRFCQIASQKEKAQLKDPARIWPKSQSRFFTMLSVLDQIAASASATETDANYFPPSVPMRGQRQYQVVVISPFFKLGISMMEATIRQLEWRQLWKKDIRKMEAT